MTWQQWSGNKSEQLKEGNLCDEKYESQETWHPWRQEQTQLLDPQREEKG
jgi:hypothetical protein